MQRSASISKSAVDPTRRRIGSLDLRFRTFFELMSSVNLVLRRNFVERLFSFAGRRSAGDSTRLDIADRRLAEEPAVLPVELASAFIADLEGRTCGIQAFVEHALSGYV